MDPARRRKTLGRLASAALPALWRVLERRGISHAKFGRSVELSSDAAAKLLYGDYSPGRRTSALIAKAYGVDIFLWDKPCPSHWRPHGGNREERKARARREHKARVRAERVADAPAPAATGTDG